MRLYMDEIPHPRQGTNHRPCSNPASVGASAGTRLVWHTMADGSLIVRAKTQSMLDLHGAPKRPKING